MIRIFNAAKIVIISLILIAFLQPASAATRVAPGAVKIGDVISFSGEVIIRSAGKWHTLVSTPYPLYNTDKVVTKRGRAEVSLVDSGTMLIDANSNTTISQVVEGVGRNRSVAYRQGNVLIGNVVFNIKLNQTGPDRFVVRTPDMIATVQDTQLSVSVDSKGKTVYDLSGDGSITGGKRADLIEGGVLTSDDITQPANSLPSVDRKIQSLPFQKLIKDAVMASSAVDALAVKRSSLADLAATTSGTSADATLIQAQAANAAADEALALAEEGVVDATAAVFEAEWMAGSLDGAIAAKGESDQELPVAKATEAKAAAEKALKETQLAASETAAALQAIIDCNEYLCEPGSVPEGSEECKPEFLQSKPGGQIGGKSSPEDCVIQRLRLNAALAEAKADLASAQAAVSVAAAQVAFHEAVRYGAVVDRDAAQEALANALARADAAQAAAENAARLYASAVATSTGMELDILLAKSGASQAAALAAAWAARAQQVVALSYIQGFPQAGEVRDRAEETVIFSNQATVAMNNALAATTLEGARGAQRAAEEAARRAEQSLQGIIGIPLPDGTPVPGKDPSDGRRSFGGGGGGIGGGDGGGDGGFASPAGRTTE